MLCFATQSADTDVINLNKRRAGSLAPYGSLLGRQETYSEMVCNTRATATCIDNDGMCCIGL